MRPLLVTGTGRCGTRAMAEAITRAGRPCTHEGGWRKDIYRLPLEGEADSAWQAAPFVSTFGGTIIHLTRHPVDVVRSFVGIGFFARDDQFTRYGRRICPRAFDEFDPVVAACVWWNELNAMVVDRADLRLQVESLLDGGVNHRQRAVITADRILPNIDHDLMERLGYAC